MYSKLLATPSVFFKLLNLLGIDRSILYTTTTRVIQGAGGVITVLFIAKYLSGIEQGFYYTFASLMGIQIFFELGLGGIITQYVAHENTHLIWNNNQEVKGNIYHISRLASLFRFCLKWYSLFALFLLVVLSVTGTIYFSIYSNSETPVNWFLPWVLLCIGTTLNFLVAPFSSFLEGLGKIKEIAQYRFWTQFATLAITWSGLLWGAKLYVGGIATITGALMFAGYLFLSHHRQTIKTLLGINIIEKVHYRTEIFPYQWKIALSWISGYFIFQLFNPVLFAKEGATVAGQMGMSLAILNAILSLSFSWITTKVPTLSGFIAQKDYRSLDKLFNRTIIQSSVINLFASLIMFIAVFTIRHFQIKMAGKSLGDILLPPLPMMFMMISVLFNHITGALAVYLRCHKQEPMLIQIIVVATLCTLSTFFIVDYFGLVGMTLSYMLLCLIGLVWGYLIFMDCKHKWHIK
jgi:hypothetical protein